MLHLEPSLKGKQIPSIYLTITGGGTGIISKLLEQGGASSYFVGADVPYSTELTKGILRMLGEDEDTKIVSSKMARVLADYSDWGFPLSIKDNKLAIGVTASLMKAEGEREGRINEAYVCFNLSGSLREYHWVFQKTYKVENLYCDPPVWEESVNREMQENELVRLLYKTLVEILSE